MSRLILCNLHLQLLQTLELQLFAAHQCNALQWSPTTPILPILLFRSDNISYVAPTLVSQSVSLFI